MEQIANNTTISLGEKEKELLKAVLSDVLNQYRDIDEETDYEKRTLTEELLKKLG